MMNISHLYESLLSKDIEININSKIENIKNANNWSDLNVNSAYDKIDFNKLGVNDIRYHASLLENISKLSVDLLLDYDYYKNFIFKGQFKSDDYDEKLRMLGYEIEGDYWHNVRKPSEDTVTMNVFLSCLFKSLVEIMSTVEQCPYCDTPIGSNDEKCSTCGEPLANMLIPVIAYKRKLSNNRINDNIEKSKIDRLHLTDKINITAENKKTGTINTEKTELMETQNGKYEATYKNMKIFQDILNKNRNQWICKTCECLNPFNLTNCRACDVHYKVNGYWICCHCSCVNEMCTDICPACNTNNELIVPANKWKCWKPICNVINDDKIRFCHRCGLQRSPPIPFSDLVERKVDHKIVKFWICESCWQYNNDKLKCCPKKNCGEPRFKETNKITDKTNIKTDDIDLSRTEERTIPGNPEIIRDNTSNNLNSNKEQNDDTDLNPNKVRTDDIDLNPNKDRTIPGNPEIIRDNTSNNLTENDNGKVETTQENHPNIDRNVVETEWKCWNKNCERMNKIKHNFCQTCKLDRNPPDPETKLVKSYVGNKMKEIWICKKCEKYNPKDTIKCEGKNCGSYKFYTANDCKDKHKVEIPNEIKKNSNQWECDKCTFVNNSKEKCCSVCDSERNNATCQTSSSWKCWFKNCRQTNDNQYEFCQHCKLDRFGSTGRGELVKCQEKNGIKEIWICQKCSKYNNLSNEICVGKKCENSRF